jgi:anhydro-N-acetylmuramic acid kinase
LQALLEEPFLHAAPPKSSGRDLFNMDWLDRKTSGDIAPVDVQATLLALTVHAIADAIQHFCIGAEEVYLCGGGAHNRALARLLEQALPHCRIKASDALGISADWMEAIAFAWLARQAMCGQCANLPAVTGARHSCILGAIHQA